MTVILLTHRPTLFREMLNCAFYEIRSPGESMAEIMFPSRLSNVNHHLLHSHNQFVHKESCYI